MELVKVWLGAAAVIVIFLALGAVIAEHEAKLEHCAAHRCT